MLTLILLLLRLTNSGTRGVWVYKIGSSSFFTDIIPGRVTTVEENVFPQEATENSEPRYSGRDEFTVDTHYETTPPEISTPETIPPEPALPDTTQLEVKPVIQDQSQPEYNYQPPQGNNPHEVYPLPRGPSPVNPQVVVVEEQDEEINVNGKILTVCNGNAAKC